LATFVLILSLAISYFLVSSWKDLDLLQFMDFVWSDVYVLGETVECPFLTETMLAIERDGCLIGGTDYVKESCESVHPEKHVSASSLEESLNSNIGYLDGSFTFGSSQYRIMDNLPPVFTDLVSMWRKYKLNEDTPIFMGDSPVLFGIWENNQTEIVYYGTTVMGVSDYTGVGFSTLSNSKVNSSTRFDAILCGFGYRNGNGLYSFEAFDGSYYDNITLETVEGFASCIFMLELWKQLKFIDLDKLGATLEGMVQEVGFPMMKSTQMNYRSGYFPDIQHVRRIEWFCKMLFSDNALSNEDNFIPEIISANKEMFVDELIKDIRARRNIEDKLNSIDNIAYRSYLIVMFLAHGFNVTGLLSKDFMRECFNIDPGSIRHTVLNYEWFNKIEVIYSIIPLIQRLVFILHRLSSRGSLATSINDKKVLDIVRKSLLNGDSAVKCLLWLRDSTAGDEKFFKFLAFMVKDCFKPHSVSRSVNFPVDSKKLNKWVFGKSLTIQYQSAEDMEIGKLLNVVEKKFLPATLFARLMMMSSMRCRNIDKRHHPKPSKVVLGFYILAHAYYGRWHFIPRSKRGNVDKVYVGAPVSVEEVEDMMIFEDSGSFGSNDNCEEGREFALTSVAVKALSSAVSQAQREVCAVVSKVRKRNKRE
jgi:hypothetical protein